MVETVEIVTLEHRRRFLTTRAPHNGIFELVRPVDHKMIPRKTVLYVYVLYFTLLTVP